MDATGYVAGGEGSAEDHATGFPICTECQMPLLDLDALPDVPPRWQRWPRREKDTRSSLQQAFLRRRKRLMGH